jgi:acyl-CoA reductase-like NAD-dependent aldehyde dehydrogenase
MSGIIATPSLVAPDRFFIDNEWIEASGRDRRDVFDSTSEELLFTVALADEADMDRAVSAARRAFDHGPWPRMTHAERAVYLNAVADEVERRADELADIWVCESGPLRSVASRTVASLSGTYRWHADLADTYPWIERRKPAVGNVGLVVREPVGVVAAIVPWNGPVAMLAHKIAPALIAGCTVIVKMSPEAPGTGLVMAEIFRAAGLPPGVVNVVTADREVSESLVRNPLVDKVTFTGSTAAWRKVAAACGERIARCTLELGGKSAGIIMDDYDVAKAAKTISAFAPFLSGQVCSSLTRIIVTKNRHDDLLDALASDFGSIRVGDPFDPEMQMGPLASAIQRERVEGYIEKGKAEGALLATGGGRPAHLNRGYFIEPTVFGRVDNGMTIAREEIFGPVLSVIPADNEQHALEIANDTDFGLNASVFTDDIEKAYRASRKLRSGTVGHNSWRTDFTVGFGGYKQSGIGREGGVDGLQAFLESKAIIMDAEPAKLW